MLFSWESALILYVRIGAVKWRAAGEQVVNVAQGQ